MQTNNDKVEVTVEEVKESTPNPNGDGVVIQADAVVDGQERTAAIEIHESDAPAVAVAVLNAQVNVGLPDDANGLPPSVRCLAVGVVDGPQPHTVRLHLQFESGQVLPVEMPQVAAAALLRGLARHLGS